MKNRELAKLLIELSYRRAPPGRPFRLASGGTSDFYFECQYTTLDPRAFPLVGRAFRGAFEELGLRPEAVGGLVLGADPIAMAVMSESEGEGIRAFRVRKEPKDHGMQRWIEGAIAPGTPVVVVEDVVTRGSSVLRAIEACESEGLRVLGGVVLVDREQGGLEAIREALGERPCGAVFQWSELQALIEEQQGGS